MRALKTPQTEVWTITVDDPDKLRAFRDAEGIEFPMLLDPGSATIIRYGVLNEADDRGIPHPTAIIVDEQGVIRYRRVDEDYRVRPAVEELLEALVRLREP